MNIASRIAFASILAFISHAAHAQSTSPAAPASADPLLKGPAIKDNSQPGEKRTFGEKGANAKRGEQVIRLPMLIKALEVVRGEKAGDLKLTADQEQRLKAAVEAQATAMREFMDKHRDEIEKLREQISPADRAKFAAALGREGGRPLIASKKGFKGNAKEDSKSAEKDAKTDAKPVDPKLAAEARTKLMEIYASRPKPEDAQAKAWAVLSEGQRLAVQAELTRLKTELEHRAELKAKGVKKVNDGLTFKGPLEGKTADEIMNDPNVPERIRERLKSLPPEQRDAAIKRFREQAANGALPKKPTKESLRNGESGGAPKPAPSPTDVTVPQVPPEATPK